MTISQEALAELLNKKHIPAKVDDHECVIIDMEPIFIWISKRPWYCDRGRWQVNCETRDTTKMCIDSADMFPRYYFHEQSLVMELVTFISTRMTNMKTAQEIREQAMVKSNDD